MAKNCMCMGGGDAECAAANIAALCCMNIWPRLTTAAACLKTEFRRSKPLICSSASTMARAAEAPHLVMKLLAILATMLQLNASADE